MSEENIEIVRRIYARWCQGDFSVGTDVFDSEIEYAQYFGPDEMKAQGVEDMARVFADYLRNWTEWRTGEIEDVLESGNTVVVFHRLFARGKHSQAAVELSDAACAFTFQDGKIVRMVPGDSRKKVLEAVGLSE